MLEFWIGVIVLISMVLAFILPVLLRPSAMNQTDSIDEKRNIYIQQFDEIEQDRMSGALDAVQYEIAKNEMERRLLDEMGALPALKTVTVKPDRLLAIMLAIFLPLVSVLLYLKLGSLNMLRQPSITSEHNTAADIKPLLHSLKTKLDNNQGDGVGWALLAKSYVALGRLNDASLAYEKAVTAIADDPLLLADYADVLASINDNKLTGKPEVLIVQALKLDPRNPKALMLAATAAFDRKDYKQAINFWERLQKELPPNSEILPDIKTSIDKARNLLGEKTPTP
jgi:cytochrome c-type biogenesis protein CcmH